jgi:hypothetical protein
MTLQDDTAQTYTVPGAYTRTVMIYSKHAREQMANRKITEKQVESTYRSYDTAVPGRAGCRNYFKTYPAEGRRIRVTIAETGAGALVVTVAEDPL